MTKRRGSSPMGVFIDQFRRNFRHTGAVLPSSRALARAMASFIGQGDAPRRILEAGPGTGVFTETIAGRMAPFDRLDVYEINPGFADYLEARFRTEPVFTALEGRLTLHREDVLALPAEATYDRIISSIPLNNFDPGWVRELLGTFMGHLTPAGVLSYFEYVFIRKLKSVVSARQERERLREIGEVTAQYIEMYQFRCDHVLFNLPPAVARHLVKPMATKLPVTMPAPGLQPATAVR